MHLLTVTLIIIGDLAKVRVTFFQPSLIFLNSLKQTYFWSFIHILISLAYNIRFISCRFDTATGTAGCSSMELLTTNRTPAAILSSGAAAAMSGSDASATGPDYDFEEELQRPLLSDFR
jgi:hypothetical protein